MKKPKRPKKGSISYRRKQNGVQTSLPPDYPIPERLPAKKKIPSISTVSLVPKHGETSTEFKSYYVNQKTKHLSHPQMVEKFKELAQLRRACWEAIVSVQAAIIPILDYMQAEIAVDSPHIRQLAPWTSTRIKALTELVDWLIEQDGRSLLFRKILRGIVESKSGLTAWLPKKLLGGNYDSWRARCRDALGKYDRLRSTIALSNLGLSMRFARRMKNRGGFSFDDLVNEGFFGLLEAVDRYEYTRGLRFSTYATHWIRHSINRCIENHGRLVRVPVHMQVNHAQILRVRDELESDPEAIAERLDMSIKTATSILSRQRVFYAHASMATPLVDENQGTFTFGDLIPSEDPSPDDVAQSAEQHRMLVRILEPLPSNLRHILVKRYGLDCEPQTLEQIGKEIGVCRERVRQLQNVALDKLRRIMNYDRLRAAMASHDGEPVAIEPSDDASDDDEAENDGHVPPEHRRLVIAFFADRNDPFTLWPVSKIAKHIGLRTYEIRAVCHALVSEGLLRSKRAKYAGMLDGVTIERLVLAELGPVSTPPGPIASTLGLPREVVAAALLRMADEGRIRRDRRAYSLLAANDVGP